MIQPKELGCLIQEEYNKFRDIIWPVGLLLTDPRFVARRMKVDARQIELLMYQTVMNNIGKPIAFKICMLGAVLGLTDLVRRVSIMKVQEKPIPSGFLKMNQKAELRLKLGEIELWHLKLTNTG